MVAARIGYLGIVSAGCKSSGGESFAEDRRVEISADVPEPGALRHLLGSDRRCHGLLRHRAAIFATAQAIPRSAHCFASTGTRETRLDGQRDHQSATLSAASRTVERFRK